MKKFTSILTTILMVVALASPTFAASQNGTGTSGDQGIGHETGNQGNDKLVGNAGGGGINLPGTNGCPSGDCDYASGNFDIDVFAVGGGLSADGVIIPNGAAGGIGVAGGIAAGTAEGAFEDFKIDRFDHVGRGNGDYNKTSCGWFCSRYDYVGPGQGSYVYDPIVIALGSADANIGVTAGGFTQTNAYTFNPGGFGIGVGSYTDNFATIGGYANGGALGAAYSTALVGGIGGQASLDGSILFGSPLSVWDSKGVTIGVAGQGAVGAFVLGGGAAVIGDYEADAYIDMWGYSESQSYRGIVWDGPKKTEYMGTNVAAFTTVMSDGYADASGLGTAFAEGGFVAGGFAASKTVQMTPTGLATASAYGTYAGAGGLGCDFSGSAIGYTHTSATTLNGYNGSIMSSSAGMQVSNTSPGSSWGGGF